MLSWLVQIRMRGQTIQPQSQHDPPHQHMHILSRISLSETGHVCSCSNQHKARGLRLVS